MKKVSNEAVKLYRELTTICPNCAFLSNTLVEKSANYSHSVTCELCGFEFIVDDFELYQLHRYLKEQS